MKTALMIEVDHDDDRSAETLALVVSDALEVGSDDESFANISLWEVTPMADSQVVFANPDEVYKGESIGIARKGLTVGWDDVSNSGTQDFDTLDEARAFFDQGVREAVEERARSLHNQQVHKG